MSFLFSIMSEQIEAIMADNSPAADSYTQILELLEHQGESFENENNLKLMYRLCVAWIRHFNRDSDIKFPVPPRNVQIINTLTIVGWIKDVVRSTWFSLSDSSKGRCLITQVKILLLNE